MWVDSYNDLTANEVDVDVLITETILRLTIEKKLRMKTGLHDLGLLLTANNAPYREYRKTNVYSNKI